MDIPAGSGCVGFDVISALTAAWLNDSTDDGFLTSMSVIAPFR